MMKIDNLLIKLGNEIHDIENEKNRNEKLKELERTKYFKEKNILLKIRELELLQGMIVQNYNISNIIPFIEKKAKEEYVELDGYSKEFYEDDIFRNEYDDKYYKVLLNIKYMLCEYLYKEDLSYIQNLLEKSINAFSKKNYRLLSFYEKLSVQIFNKSIDNGIIDIDTLKNSIIRIKEDKKTLRNIEEKKREALLKDNKKLNDLLNEIDEIFLMTIPEQSSNYIM